MSACSLSSLDSTTFQFKQQVSYDRADPLPQQIIFHKCLLMNSIVFLNPRWGAGGAGDSGLNQIGRSGKASGLEEAQSKLSCWTALSSLFNNQFPKPCSIHAPTLNTQRRMINSEKNPKFLFLRLGGIVVGSEVKK